MMFPLEKCIILSFENSKFYLKRLFFLALKIISCGRKNIPMLSTE